MSRKNVLIIGATGMVGLELTQYLLEKKDINKIFFVSRSEPSLKHSKIEKVEFNTLLKGKFAGEVHHAICCLGTTIKKAGSKAKFFEIDHDYVLKIANNLDKSKLNSFIYISSRGADNRSRNFYLQVKGKIEESIENIRFNKTLILRPSLLDGNRLEFRPLENIGLIFARWLKKIGIFKFAWASKTEDIAKRIYSELQNQESGIKILEYDEI